MSTDDGTSRPRADRPDTATTANADGDPLLSVRDLTVTFDTREGTLHAVDGIDFEVARGETVCLVGESGSGKTVACETITGLIPSPPATVAGGEIVFDGVHLHDLPESQLRGFRGDRIAHVFQSAKDALDPVYTVGEQIAEAVRLHQDVSRKQANERAIALLDRVGIPNAPDRIHEYPHEFSGGMRQRVAVAMALSCDPDLLIADEPTTGLDVTVQDEILRLLADLQDEYGMGLLFVTHDLGVVAQIADRVVVLYAGKVMERGSVFDLMEFPGHPYTQALLDCVPGRGGKLSGIEGTLPDPHDPPAGCRFHPRCPHAVEECKRGDQPQAHVVAGTEGQLASCVFHAPERDASVVLQREEPEETSPPDAATNGGEDG